MERDSFMEGSAFPMADEPSLVGQTIGAYTLREAIGQGGMGSVWRAERSDGRYEATVAVKFLNLALLGRGGVERFAREGSMLARLTHPNIARLLDAGVAAGAAAHGQPYLVLEYIDGVPIDRYCDATVAVDRKALAPVSRRAGCRGACAYQPDPAPRSEAVEHSGHTRTAR